MLQLTMFKIKLGKGMLEGSCFMRAGWVHQLKLYRYSVSEEDRFVAMRKVGRAFLSLMYFNKTS